MVNKARRKNARDKANPELRDAIERSGFKYWEVAQEMGVGQSTLTVWLRVEVSPEQRVMIEEAIQRLTKGGKR